MVTWAASPTIFSMENKEFQNFFSNTSQWYNNCKVKFKEKKSSIDGQMNVAQALLHSSLLLMLIPKQVKQYIGAE